MKPGTIPPNPFGGTNDLVKMNPPVESPNLLEPAGPTDPEVSFVSVQSPDGRPIALLANYSLHYVGTGHSEDISADYFGAFADRIEQLLGADRQIRPSSRSCANGTSGDINNINFREHRAARALTSRSQFVANAVAGEVHRVCQKLQYRDWVPLGVQQPEIDLGVRRPTQRGTRPRQRDPRQSQRSQSEDAREEVYARETVLMAKYPDEVPLILQALRIGDAGHRGDPVRGLRRDRPGDQEEEPASSRPSPSSWPTATTATCRRPSSTSSAATKPGAPAPATSKSKPPPRSSTPCWRSLRSCSKRAFP